MGLYERFPWTNFHDANLEWLIRAVKELSTYVDTKINEFDSRLVNLENNLSDEIAERIKADGELQEQITKNNYNLTIKISNLENKHNSDMEKAYFQMGRYYVASKEYTDREIAKVIELIKHPGFPDQPVFNYFRQLCASLQKTLADYYNNMFDHAASAAWLDGSGMTAGQLDSIGFSALEWDKNSRVLIESYQQRLPWLMHSPNTGSVVDYRGLIVQLFQFHQQALSCAEWDTMIWKAVEFDNKGLTAYQLDWTRLAKELDTSGI